jgi:hypothetical protein
MPINLSENPGITRSVSKIAWKDHGVSLANDHELVARAEAEVIADLFRDDDMPSRRQLRGGVTGTPSRGHLGLLVGSGGGTLP